MFMSPLFTPSTDTLTAPPGTPWRWGVVTTRAISAALALGLLGWLSQLYLLGNVHEVIPGRFYRGAQPSAAMLERVVKRHHIRTVLNVRGCGAWDDWYGEETQACQKLGVQLIDVSLSAVHYPSRDEMRLLLEALDRAEPPIFVHCRHGADRSGLAAMMALLLSDESDYRAARQQLGPWFGHVPLGKPSMLDAFVQLYEDWLISTGEPHTPARFRHWLLHEYRGGACDACFEKVERLFETPRAGKMLQYRVVVRNTSAFPWQLRTHRTAGMHVTYMVLEADVRTIVQEGRAAFMDRVIAPGQTLETTLLIAPITKPGSYRLLVDMIEEGHCWFHQTGSELWEEELVIRE